MALPDYIVRASERKAHPYHMWDGICSIETTLESISGEYGQNPAFAGENAAAKITAIAGKLAGMERIYFVGCGTSYYNGLAAQFVFNKIAGMNVTAVYALEFTEYPPLDLKKCAVAGVSHTGGTASVVAALNKAKEAGAYTLAVTDVEGSAICGAADAVLPVFGGREPSLPKTRSYLAALMKIYYLAAAVARQRALGSPDINPSKNYPEDFLNELRMVPQRAGAFLKKTEGPMKALAAKHYKAGYFFGSGINLGSVFEAALKLQETAQLISIPFELEEGMHGPWVTMNSGDLVTVLHFNGFYRNKSLELIRSLKHIGVDLLVIGNDPAFNEEVEQHFLIEGSEIFSPFFTVLPFYQMAYFMALEKGSNPDFMRFAEAPYLDTRLTLPR